MSNYIFIKKDLSAKISSSLKHIYSTNFFSFCHICGEIRVFAVATIVKNTRYRIAIYLAFSSTKKFSHLNGLLPHVAKNGDRVGDVALNWHILWYTRYLSDSPSRSLVYIKRYTFQMHFEKLQITFPVCRHYPFDILT